MEDFDLEDVRSQRREAAERTMRSSTAVEVKEMIAKVFDGRTSHPWFQTCADFIAEHRGEVVVRGELPDSFAFIFYPKSKKGIWYKFSSTLEGVGLLEPRSLQTLGEIAAAKNLNH